MLRGERRLDCQGLYDVCLALTMQAKVVGNNIDTYHKELFIITGANQGGKSTFKIIEGEPLQTSYGEDLYNGIFRTDLVETETKMNERGYNNEQI
jgi:hypothetical protein